MKWPGVPGFVGKIPSQGDFVSRRLPPDFLEPWDQWMQHGISAAKASLGEHWLNAFLVAPLWRFLLTPGVCGDQAWAGIWFPSVDRVGRHFPLTIAVRLHPSAVSPAILSAQDNWFARIEDVALQALDPEFPLDQIETALALYELTPEIPAERFAGNQPATFWRTQGSDTIAAAYLSLNGLPDKSQFAAFLTGYWTECGLSPQPLPGIALAMQ